MSQDKIDLLQRGAHFAAIIVAIVSFMGAFWGFIVAPLREDVRRMAEHQESAYRMQREDTRDRIDDLKAQMNDRITELNRQLQSLQEQQRRSR